jgi:hypothetical protein
MSNRDELILDSTVDIDGEYSDREIETSIGKKLNFSVRANRHINIVARIQKVKKCYGPDGFTGWWELHGTVYIGGVAKNMTFIYNSKKRRGNLNAAF